MRIFNGRCAAFALLACSPVPLAAADGDMDLRQQVATANHILVQQGVLDGWGHVSIRSVSRPDHFFIARTMAPAMVTAADVVEVDARSCTVVAPQGTTTYVERHIHCAIYLSRSDVGAVVHAHTRDLIPFGVANVPLVALSHVSSFLGSGSPVFEIRDKAGDKSDMLIRTPALGAALADTLGDHALVLMRGHGATIVGNSVSQAVYRAVYANEGAKLLIAARTLGAVTPLSPGEVEAANASSDQNMPRIWALWSHEAESSDDSRSEPTIKTSRRR